MRGKNQNGFLRYGIHDLHQLVCGNHTVTILPPVVLFFRAKDLLLPDFEHDFLRWVSQEAGDDKFAESVGDEASLSNILIIVNFFAL